MKKDTLKISGMTCAACSARIEKVVGKMEGVEEIPGTVLYEGLDWKWETFGDYLNRLEQQPHTINVAAQIPHDPVRLYVMGDRAATQQPATEDDVEQMKSIVREALKAGAFGFSTGRSDTHRTSDGRDTPAAVAEERELTGIEFSDDRLILGDEARANTDMTDADHAVIGTDASPEAVAQATGALPGFNEAAYQLALRDGLGGTPGQSASITLITPQPVADRQTETATLETDMMLAEVNRASLKEEAELLHDRADFDLFAPDANDEDDQLAGGNALRNLIRDVIRQELQGEMGDRISRNLRRVVRQEVAAAITAGLKTA